MQKKRNSHHTANDIWKLECTYPKASAKYLNITPHIHNTGPHAPRTYVAEFPKLIGVEISHTKWKLTLIIQKHHELHISYTTLIKATINHLTNKNRLYLKNKNTE